METTKTINNCRKLRTWLGKLLNNRIGINADWVQNHIANCPKCQRRLASIGKVHLAVSLTKSQPHKLDLLMRANTQAIGVLKHSLRDQPKARKLKVALPQLRPLEKYTRNKSIIANTAACIIVLFLAKNSIFSSMGKFQKQGQKAVKQYYANHLGQDLADEIFSA